METNGDPHLEQVTCPFYFFSDMQPLSFRSRKWTLSSPKEPSKVGHGWNLYVVDTVTPLALYQEMVRLLLLCRTALCLYADCKAVSSHVPKPGVS